MFLPTKFHRRLVEAFISAENLRVMESPPLEELRTQSMPGAAAALRGAKARILERWRTEEREALPQSDELTRQQLENSIPDLLDRIADALVSSTPAPTDQLIAISPKHGTARFHQEFSLNQLMIEYHLLRRIVIQEVAAALGRAMATEEIVAVNQGIDIALRQATVAFSDHQTAALRTETAAMTKFLLFLSHDLRGGLNGAVLMIEVLRRQLAGEPKFSGAIEDLEVVRHSILDTVATMERFLYAEKLRLRRMPVNVAPVGAAGLLDELKRSMSYQLKDRGVEMSISCDPRELTIATDRQLLTMVLQNLLSNAIKYSTGGKVAISAKKIEPIDTEGDRALTCRIGITDTGPGIAPEKLEQIFAAFSRGETYGQKGVGLGLFIAKQAAELLGAKLWVDSKPQAGSTFYVDLK